MTKSYVLGIPFYRFDLGNQDKVDEIFQTLASLDFRENDTNQIWEGVKIEGEGGSDLYNHEPLRYLFDWMQDCMAEVCDRMKIPNKMICNAAWANKNGPGEWFFDHTHFNCFISSNYFASGCAGVTRWYYPNPYFDKSNIMPVKYTTQDQYENIYNLVHEEPTVPGRFICFPPTIRHRATPNEHNCDRITVAANWFPTGMINSSGVSRLNVSVTQ